MPKRITRDRKLTPEEAERIAELRRATEQDRSAGPEFSAMIDAFEIAKMLRNAREAAGLTLADMEERTGMGSPALSQLETGARENPTVGTLSRYANALGLRVRVELVAK